MLAPEKFQTTKIFLQKNVAAEESSWKMNFVKNKTTPLEVQGKAIKRIGNFTKSKNFLELGIEIIPNWGNAIMLIVVSWTSREKSKSKG